MSANPFLKAGLKKLLDNVPYLVFSEVLLGFRDVVLWGCLLEYP